MPTWLQIIDIVALLACAAAILYLLKTRYRE